MSHWRWPRRELVVLRRGKAYGTNPFDLRHNRGGVIQIGLSKNQLSLDLIEEWSKTTPRHPFAHRQAGLIIENNRRWIRKARERRHNKEAATSMGHGAMGLAAEAVLALRAADPLPMLRRRHDALPPRLFAQLHALLLTAGLAHHSPNLSLLLRLASPALSVSHRLHLLLCSPLPPTTFLANSLLAASSPRCFPSSLSLYSLLFLSSTMPPPPLLRPNAFTYPLLFRAAPPAVAFALATHSVKFLGTHAASYDRFLGAALLDVFARCGRIASCRRVFDRIARPDLPAWNALLSAYARCASSAADTILELFARMLSLATIRPNEITLVAVIGACGELGALGHGIWAHTYLVKRQLAINCIMTTALVEMYARCGRLDLAEHVFATTSDRDTRCYNAMLQGLAAHGHGRAALALFDRMRGSGMLVDGVTVLSVLCSCAHAGLVDEGLEYFDKMEIEFGIEPRIEHYGCVVDMLSRAGRLDDAEKLIHEMPIAPNAAIYRSLIRACGIHGKLEFGERMITELRRLDLKDSGNHVLIANLYARMNRWEEAKKARKEMKSMGIDKSPGSSLLDMNGILHEFLVGDKRHPAAKEIYTMVEEIETRLSEHGHRSNTTSVLFDVEEEDKADTLTYHSERLAIAFALIASNPGTPIRIIKNLRVCADCHESAKLVSQVYGREIVMRDRTRFHHFREGECSCGDFW
ncbi:pentatricopeptide repeat-containing protein At5g43790-like [Oryza brachyantha]|uniref:pentatricopeptide repeat-containing protein At5g43790-like n=1 Tax=Oryza brachyantha TaxID=4533 RepID=UPI001ADCC3CF|nr:pentatricopeptide repeat-containing protein At5g43790-like [Oryza brachyantha]